MPASFDDLRVSAKRVAYGAAQALWQVITGFSAVRLRINQRLGRRVTSPDPVYRISRVAELAWHQRARTRVWLAGVHGWHTRWAGFDWYIEAEVKAKRVAIAGIVDRAAKIGETPVRLALVGGVLTYPRYRGSGLATELLERCASLSFDVLGCDACVLTCGDGLVDFYQERGWTYVDKDLTFERFGQRQTASTNVMIQRRCGTELPAGAIDVMGLPA